MKLYILKVNTILLIYLITEFCMSKPARDEHRRRISSFNGRIFRNRRERSIKLMDDTDDIEDVDDVENNGQEHISDEYEEIPLDEEEKVGEEVKDKKVKGNIVEESFLRRFMKRMRMMKKEPVEQVSYIKKDKSVESLINRDEEKKNKEQDKQDKQDEKNKIDKKEEIVENKIDIREAILTGIKTEIGTTRLPKKIKVTVDTHEELAKPGTSNDYSKVIEELEKVQMSKGKKESELEEVIYDVVNEMKQIGTQRETKI